MVVIILPQTCGSIVITKMTYTGIFFRFASSVGCGCCGWRKKRGAKSLSRFYLVGEARWYDLFAEQPIRSLSYMAFAL